MGDNKLEILNNICYTELVYERINKKLNCQLTKLDIEKMLFDLIEETDENHFEKIGKNYYITNTKRNVKITVNSNTYRVITADFIDRALEQIMIKPFQDEDIPLFSKWLNKAYIYKWLCPNGEGEKEAWMEQVSNRTGKYSFIKHFIIYSNKRKIGYCLYADCFFLKDLEEEGHDFEALYGDVMKKNDTYEIGYLIGEEEYLNRGISKIVIRKLEEKIRESGGREIAADPSEENIFSIKALLSNGFKKKSDGDYRKYVQSL